MTEFDPKKRYHLRGILVVADQKDRLYLLQDHYDSSSDPLEIMETKPQRQWWRLCYDVSVPASASVDKVTQEVTLDAARDTKASISLVYANDEMLSTENTGPLPASLEEFVRADNNTFRGQVDAAQQLDVAVDQQVDSAMVSRSTSFEDEPMASAQLAEQKPFIRFFDGVGNNDRNQLADTTALEQSRTDDDDPNERIVEMQEVQRNPTGKMLYRGIRGRGHRRSESDEEMDG